MKTINTNFASWYQSQFGYPPFPWHERMAKSWATAVGTPTGTGKTTVIAIWLWRMLVGQDVPTRICYTVDRRALVDGAFDYATELVEKCGLQGEVDVVKLRGGTFDNAELPLPNKPAIICSTVDQMGSRLLMQGYGVGTSRRPQHAMLFGTDCLIVLDEAHISAPLMKTLKSCVEFGASISVLPMSATLRDTAGCINLEDDDYANKVITERVGAKKWAELKTSTAARAAIQLRKGGANSIAVWCNTVAKAVATADELRKQDHGAAVVVLITGRDRLYERQHVMNKWHPKLKSDPNRKERPKVFVVTTQCLEVGVDWDFQAMASECADIPALRQRLGRLDRLGKLQNTKAIICKPPKKDWVYGKSSKHTWDWLTSNANNDGVIDFGLSNRAFDSIPEECLREQAVVPTLTSKHLDAWSINPCDAAATRPAEGGLELPGLVGTNLLGWMAAVGIARIMDCTLWWRKVSGRLIAVVDVDLTHENLAETLHKRTGSNPWGQLDSLPPHKLSPELYARLNEEWQLATAVTANDGGFSANGMLFGLNSGKHSNQQKLDKIIAKVTVDDMLAAIVGPWKRHKESGLRWDAAEHAEASDILSKPDPMIAYGPTRLAVESLPLMPTLADNSSAMCQRVGSKDIVRWPLWYAALDSQCIAARIIAGKGDQVWACERIDTSGTSSRYYSVLPPYPIRQSDAVDGIPDVAPFLHGYQEQTDVRVVWRKNVTAEALALVPPRVIESASVSMRDISKIGPEETITRFRGRDKIEEVATSVIRPGDVVVLGLKSAVKPPNLAVVPDIAEEASCEYGMKIKIVTGTAAREAIDVMSEQEILNETPDDSEDGAYDLKEFEVVPYPDGYIIRPRRQDSVVSRERVTLQQHSHDVAETAKRIGATDSVIDAAMHHDDGKLDPRMQRWMEANGVPLAKSGQTSGRSRSMRRLAGYPRRQRHELLSGAIYGLDDPLARFAIDAHHGYCRPWAPPQYDVDPLVVEGVRTDQVTDGHEQRYWKLVREHGWWGLASHLGLLTAADGEMS